MLTFGLIDRLVSLFTRMPLVPTSELFTSLFPEATVWMFEFVQKSTYLMYNGEFHEQVEGVVMGSPLAPVTDFFMEALEEKASEQAP